MLGWVRSGNIPINDNGHFQQYYNRDLIQYWTSKHRSIKIVCNIGYHLNMKETGISLAFLFLRILFPLTTQLRSIDK